MTEPSLQVRPELLEEMDIRFLPKAGPKLRLAPDPVFLMGLQLRK